MLAFRVVGDNSTSWAEATSLWVGVIDFIVNFEHNNHVFQAALDLLVSFSVEEAQRLSLTEGSMWDRILLATILRQKGVRGMWVCFICSNP